ncbi:MAG: endonuclease/exonuclease/phosphatase family protein [Thermoanaerobaculia bacterium]
MEQLSEEEHRGSTPPRRLAVMSYNIQGQAALYGAGHIEAIGEVIDSSRVDLVGLQEVHRETWRSRFRDQAEELRARTGMNLVFASSMELGRGAYGNALLTRGTVLHSMTHRLPGRGEPRTMLEALVELRGGVFTAYVTHLAAWGRLRAVTRLRQTSQVSRLVGRSRLPFVLMGDFNSPPTSRELRMFSDRSTIISCVDALATHRVTGKCLDYIFVDPQWSVTSARVLKEGPSDHWPLTAELERRTVSDRMLDSDSLDSDSIDERERPA